MYVPNSYEFFWNTSADSFRDRMLKEYNRFWNETRLKRAEAIGLSPLEVVTLASIVHKETAMVDERPRVAGVYMNRLNRNMLLQADPTIQYIIPGGNRRLYNKDLKLDSPYNTYRFQGLPPGPIASPGEASIRAALYPIQTNYLYFVSRNDGSHQFSTTLAEHNLAVKKYQLQRRRRSS